MAVKVYAIILPSAQEHTWRCAAVPVDAQSNGIDLADMKAETSATSRKSLSLAPFPLIYGNAQLYCVRIIIRRDTFQLLNGFGPEKNEKSREPASVCRAHSRLVNNVKYNFYYTSAMNNEDNPFAISYWGQARKAPRRKESEKAGIS